MAYLEFQKGNRWDKLGLQKLPYKEHRSSRKQEKEVSKGFYITVQCCLFTHNLLNVSLEYELINLS